MNIMKKQGVGAYITLVAAVLAIVGLITYAMTVATGNEQQVANGGEYFLIKDELGSVTAVGIIAVVCLVLSLVASQFPGKVCEIVAYVLRAAAPALLICTFVFFLNGTLTGLGWTFFSNEELVIYDAAIKAGQLTITTLVIWFVAALVGMVGAFFNVTKKD